MDQAKRTAPRVGPAALKAEPADMPSPLTLPRYSSPAELLITRKMEVYAIDPAHLPSELSEMRPNNTTAHAAPAAAPPPSLPPPPSPTPTLPPPARADALVG
eukprot:scaffold10173_cov119-Isochrysis_galbana.AAC.4